MALTVETDESFDLPFPRERVWPILSRTDWINRSLGLPPVQYDLSPAAGGGSNVRARTKIFGLEIRWDEQPFQWLENEFYQVDRHFEGGPVEHAHLVWEFTAPTPTTTKIRVFTRIQARNVLGHLLCKYILEPKATRDVAAVIRHLNDYLRGDKPIVLPKLARQPIVESSFEAALAKLRQTGQQPDLIERLATLIREAPDVFAARIRPFAVARDWKADEWDVLRLFLHATRAGLLSLSWEVLCPNCRLSRQPLTDTLANIRNQMHCEACQIQYNAEFDKSVELRFAVHPSIRTCENDTFCLAGPGSRPHIVAQINLQPNERRAWPWPKTPTLYRLRSPQVEQSKTVEPAEYESWLQTSLHLGPKTIESKVLNLNRNPNLTPPSPGLTSAFAQTPPSPTVEAHNPFPYPIQLILERVETVEPILTAARVTNWQEFRDLFSREVISPTERITVGEQIVLFTDLRGSTAMYCGIGDAPAYALVREHFAILQKAISDNRGSVVKTIGDAVMAVFTRIPEALAAVEQMHHDLAARGEKLPLQLKSALHLGPCLAVNANDRLDYFGTTINLAARLVEKSTGGDLVVSDDFYSRPETQKFFSSGNRALETSSVQFRGFADPVQVWRVQILR